MHSPSQMRMRRGGKGALIQRELSATLSCSNVQTLFQSTTIVIDRAAFNQGVNAQYPPHIERTDLMDTLVARGPHAVAYMAGVC